MFYGSDNTPLYFVEVTPVILSTSTQEDGIGSPRLSAPSVKLHLSNLSVNSWSNDQSILLTTTGWEKVDSQPGLWKTRLSSSSSIEATSGQALLATKEPLVRIPSEDPFVLEPIPCRVVGYGYPVDFGSSKCFVLISDRTLVRVLPFEAGSAPKSASLWLCQQQFGSQLLGESVDATSTELLDEVIDHFDPEIVQALKLRMSRLLAQTVRIGTSVDAIPNLQKQTQRRANMMRGLLSYTTKPPTLKNDKDDTTPADSPKNPIVGSADSVVLTVHSPEEAAGKTLLAKAIAHRLLRCPTVHVLQPAALMAKHGVHADAALESLLHDIVISAAVRGSVCIILDHLDCLLPSNQSGGAEDPVINGMVSLLKRFVKSIARGNVPFPTKNPVYNLGGEHGIVLNVELCLVGITTFAERQVGAEWRPNVRSPLDVLPGGRFRLPDMTTKQKVASIIRRLHRDGIDLTSRARVHLHKLVMATPAMDFRAITRVCQKILVNLEERNDRLVDIQDIWVAFDRKMGNTHGEDDNADNIFSSVGGNTKAKLALEDALAIHADRREILRRFGMSPPSGVLLYGPPGTGKTLLAKAVANLLGVQGDSQQGGSFLSLEASEIVRSEVGNSEKRVVSVFDTARDNAPSVVFIDEFQALFTARSGRGSGQLASTLLQCLDDVNRWNDVSDDTEEKRVVVMGATNAPWMIDKAFLRPGRFDRVVHVGLPTGDERRSILRVMLQRMSTTGDALATDFLDDVVERTNGFSGADLAALCRAAATRCLRENGGANTVETVHFLEALEEDVTASSNSRLVARLENWSY